jgi:hypothetical protein
MGPPGVNGAVGEPGKSIKVRLVVWETFQQSAYMLGGRKHRTFQQVSLTLNVYSVPFRPFHIKIFVALD